MKLITARSFHHKVASKSYFVTTPIFYVNSVPHLGHVYTAIISDVAHRFHKLLGCEKSIFSTGTDEHGLKVQQAANREILDPLKFCDTISEKFKSVFKMYNVQYSDFVRTTEERHKNSVEKFFNAIESRGHIYKAKYEGWYCVSEESFLTEKQIEKKELTNGTVSYVSKETGHVVDWNSETNYIFRLSDFQNDLLYWLKKSDRIVPSRFQDELKLWISSGLYDLSISRPKSRVSWGISMPNDKNHTFYVWLDALSNYLTVSGYPNTNYWPPNLQVIGKDILRFHGIYWPALLMAANMEPPEKLLVHSHWKVDGVKMSKSIGNVICPINLLNTFTADAVRYVLLRSGTFHSDSSWSNIHAANCANSDLANTFGNLLNRCTAPSLNPDNLMPSIDEQFLKNSSSTCKSLLNQIQGLYDKVGNHFHNHNYYMGIDDIMAMGRTANLFIEEEKPWELKNSSDKKRLNSILYMGLLAIRAGAICLQPIVPDYSNSILNSLNIPVNERMWDNLNNDYLCAFSSPKLGKRAIAFKKIKIE